METINNIHELIENFDFTALTIEQQELVLSEMTKQEYDDIRETIVNTSAYFDGESILMAEDLTVPSIKKESVLVKIINYQLPVYKVAAILVIVLSIDYLVPEEEVVSTQIVENKNEFRIDSDNFLTYNRYTSNNSIKYDEGFSRVYN